MKRSAVYKESARRLAEGETLTQWSCWAICETLGVNLYSSGYGKQPLAAAEYELLFRPDVRPGTADYEHRWGHCWDVDERNDCRILALCFMAAIAASERDA